MQKYYPEIEILSLLHRSGETDGCELLKRLSNIIPHEDINYYTHIINVLSELHEKGLINATPAPNLKDPNSIYSITAKGLKLLENKYQSRKERIKRLWCQLAHDLSVAIIGALLSNSDKIYSIITVLISKLLNE